MTLISAAAAVAVGMVLVAAAVGHLRDPRATRAALAAHGLLPAAVRRVAAPVLPLLELLLGTVLVLAVVAGHGASVPLPVGEVPLLPAAATGATVLLGAFTAYLALVVRRTRGAGDVPCGCGLGATPVGHWAVLRAAALVTLSTAAAVGGAPDWGTLASDQAPLAAQVFVVGAAGLVLAVTTAALPAARAVPPTLTSLHPVGGAR